MRRRSLFLLAGGALTIPLAGCPAPQPSTPANVASLAVVWAEDIEGSNLQPDAFTLGQSLIRDQSAWQEWAAALPAPMRTARASELATVDLTSSVAVIAFWARCRETPRVERVGPGELRFDLSSSSTPPVVCDWSPRRLEVWLVGLAVAGVSDREQVRLLN